METTQALVEKELVSQYVAQKKKHEDLKNETARAWEKFERTRQMLVELLKLKDATSTADYAGLGRVTLVESMNVKCTTDDRELFGYLESIDRMDLVKQSVHHKTLGTFAKEMLELGKPLPEFIEVTPYTITKLTGGK